MSCIVLCGGGGKTTIFENYPENFLDIDYFMWNNNKYITALNKAIQNKDINRISEIYEDAMKNDEELRNDSRILLVHTPINAFWLNRDILKILRPSKNLHKTNIKYRDDFFKKLAILDWEHVGNLDYLEFKNFVELENFIFELVSKI